MAKPKNNAEKDKQLGMSHGTAVHRLRKMIMFELIQKCGLDNCHQCGKKIDHIDKLSVDHKTPWLHSDNPVFLFFDLDNIAFSHRRCNISAARKPEKGKHPSHAAYKRGCRCRVCVEINNTAASKRMRKVRSK